jgi:hypothetical protein
LEFAWPDLKAATSRRTPKVFQHPAKPSPNPLPEGEGQITTKNGIFLDAMTLLILNHSEVEQLLPMNECITVMEEAFKALARDEFHQPLRTITKPPNVKGVMALMPTFRAGETPLFGLEGDLRLSRQR